MWKCIIILAVAGSAACADHPCTQECDRQMVRWRQTAAERGDTMPESTCEAPAIEASKSCAECETVLRDIAERASLTVLPVCDGVTEAS